MPTTWDEYLETGAALAEEGIAMSYITDHGGMFMMYLLQRGGAIFDQHGEFVLPEEENRTIAIEVLNLLREGLGQRRDSLCSQRRSVGTGDHQCVSRRQFGRRDHARLVFRLHPETASGRYG